MGLLSRISDLFVANAHHAIDQAENPEVMLGQVIREMDRNIQGARASVVSAVAGEKQLGAQVDHHRRIAVEMEGKAESALKADREDLARQALARKVEHHRIADDLERTRGRAGETCRRLKAQLDALIEKRAEAGRQKEVLTARQRTAQARVRLGRSLAAVSTVDTTSDKLARMRERVASMEAEAAAVTEVLDEPPQLEKDIAEIETAAQVDEALESLKARLHGDVPSA